MLETGRPQEGFREGAGPSGARCVYRVHAVPWRDHRGAIGHVFQSFVDVAEIAHLLSLSQSEEAKPAAGLAVDRGAYVVEPKGRIVSWSSGMETILGYSSEEILGRDVREIVPRHRWARLDEPSAWSDDAVSFETERVARGGHLVPVRVMTNAIRDPRGDVCGYRTTVEDLSEISRIRRARARSAAALARVATETTDAIFSTDESSTITSWNRGATTLLGYSGDEARQLRFPDLFVDRAEAQALADEARQLGCLPLQRMLMRTRQGGRTLADLTITALPNRDGLPGGLSIIGRDARAKARLEQQEIHSEKLTAVGSLLAGLAHEIGTPLNVISASAEYALLELGPEQSPRHEVESILEETQRIQRLISEVLGHARAGRPTTGTTEPRAAIERVVRLIHPQLDRRRIRFELEVSASPVPRIAADADVVHQVLLNLVLNAIDAVALGGWIGVEIHADALPRRRHTAPAVRIAVCDDGPGVPPALRQRIFDPFFTTRAAGSGLGLAICNGIVTGHGGTLTVAESDLGGALFETVWPCAPAQSDAAQRTGV